VDLLLSSGFLAFARHLGFLDALTATGAEVEAVVGTSSGAMVGALYLAGADLDAIAAELGSQAPLRSLALSRAPWRGLLSMAPVQERLTRLLPARFSDLPRPFAVGVVGAGGRHTLVTEGELVAAVCASCAMPGIFHPIDVNGVACKDGGAADRLGVDAWRAWRPGRTAVAHWVERTAGKDVEADLAGVTVIRTPRSGAKLWSLGDFDAQRAEARAQAEIHLRLRPADAARSLAVLDSPRSR